MTESVTPLAKDYTLEEVAAALGMSTRWLRGRIKQDQLEHLRYGHVIKFTATQVEAIRARYTAQPITVEQSVTTGRKRKSA